MGANVESMRQALQELTDQWDWSLSFSPLPGRQRLKLVAREKTAAGRLRSLTIDHRLLDHLSAREVAGLFSSFLPNDRARLEVECRICQEESRPQPPPHSGQSAYHSLCGTYRADLQALKTQSAPPWHKRSIGPAMLSRLRHFFSEPKLRNLPLL